MSDFNNIRFQPQRPLLREISADRLNTILQEIKRNKPLGERGITVRQDGNGTYIGLAASLPRGASSGAVTTHPFQISSRQDSENQEAYLVTVRPGTINNLLPTGIFDGDTLRQIEIGSGLQYVVLQAQSDGRQITSASISVESAAPGAQSPVVFGLPSSFGVFLGIVKESSVFQIVKDNILLTGKQQFVAQKTPPVAVGALPYEIYYVWG